MKLYKIIIFNALLLLSFTISAKDYKASLFGCKSDGITLNTGSIQYAIDYISENGGGTLHFYVGRYLTGSFYMKPNVKIELHEGAILVAFHSIYDYFELNGTNALILADNVENIGISGKGVIEGNGAAVLKSTEAQIQKGYIEKTEAQAKPALINFNGCSNISFDEIILENACGDAMVYSGCKNVKINNVTIKSTVTPNSKGVVVSGCDGFALTDSYFETSGTEISSSGDSKNISVQNTITPQGKKLKLLK